ncbi:hypothetical protein E4U41_003157 [Claviceps citrina]|nr:hypothetical protein E4U41_003157 [Claviceps citrina]
MAELLLDSWTIHSYYVPVNKRRDEDWLPVTREERVHYLATTKDESNKRLSSPEQS